MRAWIAVSGVVFLLGLWGELSLAQQAQTSSRPASQAQSTSAASSQPALARGKGPAYKLPRFFKGNTTYVMMEQTTMEYSTPQQDGDTFDQSQLRMHTFTMPKGEVSVKPKWERHVRRERVKGSEQTEDSATTSRPTRTFLPSDRFVFQGSSACNAKVTRWIMLNFSITIGGESTSPAKPEKQEPNEKDRLLNNAILSMMIAPFYYAPPGDARVGQQWSFQRPTVMYRNIFREDAICTFARVDKARGNLQAVIRVKGTLKSENGPVYSRTGEVRYDLKTGKLVSWEMKQTLEGISHRPEIPVKSVMTVHLDEIPAKAATSDKSK